MGVLTIALLSSLLVMTSYGSHQTYPGTSTRPVLSNSEAEILSEENYLQGWSVEGISIPSTPDYSVGSTQTYTDIQQAVNAAINAGGTSRKYIAIDPGTYAQSVYVTGSVPLTIYGTGSSPSNVSIILSQPADMTVSAYIDQVNPDGSRYSSGDPGYKLYKSCASKSDTIGTSCSSIFWITASNVQVYNLQVTNTYTSNGVGQSVALKTDADKVRLSTLNLISRQDTLYAGSNNDGVVQRVYIDNTYIEGDVDFVFGGAATVFTGVTFKAVSDRHPSGAIVFAPSTVPGNSYGFLAINSVITADSTFKSSQKVNLARAWDAGVSAGDYVADSSPNGQLVIRSTEIDLIINADAPYATSTSKRAYSGNNDTSRDLNDNTYNRFWEYDNTGDGA
ncbi:pectinesterase [Dendroctonus ponderosae]|uniref:Pectinesterase n=1 Tax=Dendroctonus ponderosae TaxID=77166 RepID=E7CIW2_DENPD|nr:pectinesterase [Dendroctonus ponderosae]AEE63085.1 unknown [Dendroctonus ponderosae]ERL91726.1 hypothetical protein D910_09053 [Dendroctonus ponderosae]KAH1021959.1 hypothetical protein HUJ04_011441 [Dendroctonus ponderosae]KAH1028627.1 hypothetical protein HUJ05_001965 [Dendroctonus ponderosae]